MRISRYTALAGMLWLLALMPLGGLAQPTSAKWTVQPYEAAGDEAQRYERAADLALLGRDDDALPVIQALVDEGYPPALRYRLTREWDPSNQRDLSRGCKEDRREGSVPSSELERLALTGDRRAIVQYWTCIARGRRTDRAEKNWRGAHATMHWLADSGDSNAASILFWHYLAGADWVRTPKDLMRYFQDRRVMCGRNCRLPDVRMASSVAKLSSTDASMAEALAWYYNSEQNIREAAAWAAEAAARFSALDRAGPWNRPWAAEGAARMSRLAKAIAALDANQ